MVSEESHPQNVCNFSSFILSTPGMWKWTDGSVWDYTQWGQASSNPEPNNGPGNLPENREFKVVMFGNGNWGTEADDRAEVFALCEYPL